MFEIRSSQLALMWLFQGNVTHLSSTFQPLNPSPAEIRQLRVHHGTVFTRAYCEHVHTITKHTKGCQRWQGQGALAQAAIGD